MDGLFINYFMNKRGFQTEKGPRKMVNEGSRETENPKRGLKWAERGLKRMAEKGHYDPK